MNLIRPTLAFIALLSFCSASAQTLLGDPIVGVARSLRSGSAVAASGNLLAVGAPVADPTGVGRNGGWVKVYEYDAPNDEWVPFGNTITGQAEDEFFGRVVALTGRRLFVGTRTYAGSSGYVGVTRAYEFDGTAWVQLGADIPGPSEALSADGDRIAIGWPNTTIITNGGFQQGGTVDVYEWDGSTWGRVGQALTAPSYGGQYANFTQEGYGFDVALYGDRLAVGVPGLRPVIPGSQRGGVYVYELTSGGQWVDPDGALTLAGMPQNANTFNGENFGARVDLHGEYLAVTAPSEGFSTPGRGSVRLFARDAAGAYQQSGAELRTTRPPTDIDLLGTRLGLGIDDDQRPSNNEFVGSAQVHEFYNGQWNALGSKVYGRAPGTATSGGGLFGAAVALAGDRLYVGEPRYDVNTATSNDNGAAYAYVLPASAACPAGSDPYVLSGQTEVDAYAAAYPQCSVLPYALRIRAASDLSGLSGLAALNLPSATAPTGRFLDVEFGSLTSLAGLDNLTYAESVTLDRNNSLTSLSGLAQLEDARIFNVRGSALADLSSWPVGLNHTRGSLFLEEVPLTSVAGLPADLRLEGLVLSRLPNLTSLTGLSGVFAERLTVQSNPALTSLSGAGAASVGVEIGVSSNPLLTDLGDLGSVTAVDPTDLTVSISGNGLTSVAGLAGLTTVKALGVVNEDALPDFSGLENLTAVTDNLLITGNAVLTSIAQLGANAPASPAPGFVPGFVPGSAPAALVQPSELIELLDNPLLSTCSSPMVCDATPSTLAISGNAMGCASPAEVTAACNTPVPVTLVSLSAKPTPDSHVEISWRTAQELGVGTYHVERAVEYTQADALAPGEWVTVATADSRGDSERGRDYLVADAKPDAGANYYRLRIIDLDGSEAISGVVSAEVLARAATASLRVYPNPVSDVLTVSGLPAETTAIRLADAFGRVIRTRAVAPGVERVRIDVSSVPAGIYVLTPEGDDAASTRVVVP